MLSFASLGCFGLGLACVAAAHAISNYRINTALLMLAKDMNKVVQQTMYWEELLNEDSKRTGFSKLLCAMGVVALLFFAFGLIAAAVLFYQNAPYVPLR